VLSYLQKPLIVHSDLTEFTSLYCVKRRKFVPYSEGSSIKKHTPYLSYNDFFIITPNISTFFSTAVFYTKHLTPYIISVCLNSLLISCSRPIFFCNNTNNYCIQFLYRVSQSHCADDQSGAALC